MENKINIIYGLRDPKNDVYQYIGKSTVGIKRPLTHLTKSHSSRVNEWVAKLAEEWKYPIVDIIEEVDDINDLIEREKYWIDYYYGLNPNLLNIQSIDPSVFNLNNEEDEIKFNYLSEIIFDIPKILKKERLRRNLSQDEIANKMGVSRSTVSCLENGHSVRLINIQQYLLALKGVDFSRKISLQRARKQNN